MSKATQLNTKQYGHQAWKNQVKQTARLAGSTCCWIGAQVFSSKTKEGELDFFFG